MRNYEKYFDELEKANSKYDHFEERKKLDEIPEEQLTPMDFFNCIRRTETPGWYSTEYLRGMLPDLFTCYRRAVAKNNKYDKCKFMGDMMDLIDKLAWELNEKEDLNEV